MVSLLFGSVLGRTQKGNSTAAWPLEFCLGGSYLLALTWMPEIAVSPLMPLVPFHLLHWCWSPEEVCVSPQSIMGPLRGDAWESCTFFLQPQPPLVFIARSYGDLPSWNWNPGLGGLVWGWDPLLLRYLSQFSSITCVWDCTSAPLHLCISLPLHASPYLRPSYLSGWMWLLQFLGCWTSISLDFLMSLCDSCFVV